VEARGGKYPRDLIRLLPTGHEEAAVPVWNGGFLLHSDRVQRVGAVGITLNDHTGRQHHRERDARENKTYEFQPGAVGHRLPRSIELSVGHQDHLKVQNELTPAMFRRGPYFSAGFG
jgi:hypothetical protein